MTVKLNYLPNDAIEEITLYLSVKELGSLELVNKELYNNIKNKIEEYKVSIKNGIIPYNSTIVIKAQFYCLKEAIESKNNALVKNLLELNCPVNNIIYDYAKDKCINKYILILLQQKLIKKQPGKNKISLKIKINKSKTFIKNLIDEGLENNFLLNNNHMCLAIFPGMPDSFVGREIMRQQGNKVQCSIM